MSKFKYTSLLSSQYTKVFKSYHSLDRHEAQLKDNLYQSVNKRQIKKNFSSNSDFSRKKQNIKIQRNMKKIQSFYDQKSRIQSENLIRTQPIEKSSFQSSQNFYKKQSLCKNILSSNENIKISSHKENTSASNVLQFKQNVYLTKKWEQNSQSRKNELNTQLSEINKKRNELKLKIRVKDIHKIDKKYNYLDKIPDQKENVKQTFQNDQFQKNYKSNIINLNQNLRRNAQKPLINANLENLRYQRRCPLQQQNYQMIHQNQFYNQKKFGLQQALKSQGKRLCQFKKQQESIQTPHFYQAQAKQVQIMPSLIEKKLQNIVKNTFSDRY